MSEFDDRVEEVARVLRSRMTGTSKDYEDTAMLVVRALDALPAQPLAVNEELRREMAKNAQRALTHSTKFSDWEGVVDAVLAKLPRNPVVVTSEMVERAREAYLRPYANWMDSMRATLVAALSPSADASNPNAGGEARLRTPSPAGARVGADERAMTEMRAKLRVLDEIQSRQAALASAFAALQRKLDAVAEAAKSFYSSGGRSAMADALAALGGE